jgi:hypothetical protein
MAQRPTSLAEVAAIELDGRAAAGRPPDIIVEQSKRRAHACHRAVLRIHPDKAASDRQLLTAYEPYFRELNHRLDQLAHAS